MHENSFIHSKIELLIRRSIFVNRIVPILFLAFGLALFIVCSLTLFNGSTTQSAVSSIGLSAGLIISGLAVYKLKR